MESHVSNSIQLYHVLYLYLNYYIEMNPPVRILTFLYLTLYGPLTVYFSVESHVSAYFKGIKSKRDMQLKVIHNSHYHLLSGKNFIKYGRHIKLLIFMCAICLTKYFVTKQKYARCKKNCIFCCQKDSLNSYYLSMYKLLILPLQFLC